MKEMKFQRSVSSIGTMVALGQERGLSESQCLAGTGLKAGQLEQADQLVTSDQELQVVRNLVEAFPADRSLGFQAGLRYQVTTLGIWGFAIVSSPTLRSAIETALRYIELSFVLIQWDFQEDGETASIGFRLDKIPLELREFLMGRHMGVAYKLMLEIFDKQVMWLPERIELIQAPDNDLLTHFPLLKEKVITGCDNNRIVFNSDLLNIDLPKANPATSAFCLEQCEALLNKRKTEHGFAQQVRRLLLESSAAMPSLNQAAEHFLMSSRTFRRRLDDEETSFRKLVESTRQGIALELLESGLTVESVAEHLGYAEPASFIHAFRRWTGTTPGRYRHRG